MSFSEWSNAKKKRVRDEQETQNVQNTKAVSGGTFSEWSNKKISSQINQDYIKSFMSEADSYFSDVEKEYGSLGWGNASPSYYARSERFHDLETKAQHISSWLEVNKNKLDNDTYNSIYDSVEFVRNNGYSVLDSYKKAKDFYAQFGTEEEYTSWKEIQDARSSEDFDEYSSAGTNVANPDWYDAHAPVDIFGWKPFGDGETVNNMVTFAETNATEAYKNAGKGGTAQSTYGEIISLINNHMSDEEKQIYNYYVGKGDTEKANKYLTYITDILRQRAAGKIVETVDNTGLEPIASLAVGVENWASGVKNLDNFITGEEGDETTIGQYAHSEMSKNNDGVWKVVNDLSTTTGNMLPSILVGTATSGLGGALTLGVSAVGNAYSEMRNLGYDEWQSRGYAALTGASEAALSYALGGISKLGGGGQGVFQTISSKIIPKLDNAIARVAIDLGGNMLDEGLEEAIQEVLDPVFKMVATGEDFEGIDLDNVLYSGLLGALSAGFLEGAPTIAGTAINSKKAKNTYGGDVQALVTESLDIDPDNSHAQRMQSRLDKGKNVSGYQIDRLVDANESALVSQDKAKMKSAVETRLAELGESGDVSKLADIIVKKELGEKLSRSESKILSESENGEWVADELSTDPIYKGFVEEFSNWAGNIGTERINTEAYNRGETTPVTKNATVKETATEAKFEGIEQGQAITACPS